MHTHFDDQSVYYRIPAIVRLPDGTIITACDKRGSSNADLASPIQIVIRVSHDDGINFGPPTIIAGTGKTYGYSDPSLIADRKTGAVLCVFNAGNRFQSSTSSNRIRNVYCISYDSGKTWSDPIDFTNQMYGCDCTDPVRKNWNALFITSGSGIQLRNGKMMFPVVCRVPGLGNYPVYLIWTNDLGRTWHFAKNYATIGDESKIVQLDNGSLLMSSRSSPRKFVLSDDEGETWYPPVVREEMIDPGCNGDLIRYTSTLDGFDRSRLIHTNQYNSGSRRNLTIKISYDEGNTWPVVKSLYPELSAYSAAEIAGDGSILIFFEKEWAREGGYGAGYDMALLRVTLDYVTDGEDTYTPPTNRDL